MLGDPYTNGFFYHPLQFLILGNLDFILSANSVSLRHHNSSITYLHIGIILFCSLVNYFALTGARMSPSTFFICFLSAPVLFLISRLNLLLFLYLLVTLYFSAGRRLAYPFNFVIVWPLAAIIKPYFLLFPLFIAKSLRETNIVLSVVGAVSLLSAVAYNFPLSNNPNTTSLSLIIYVQNLLNFATGHSLSIYEILALNYSPFAYTELVKALHTLHPSVSIILLVRLMSLLNFLAIGIFMCMCFKIIRKHTERESFLLFTLGLATVFPNLGGYALVLCVPLLKELKGFLNGAFVPVAAVMFCPVDFTFVFADSLIFTSEIWPEVDKANLSAIGQAETKTPISIQHGVIRRDISVLGLVRPLALVVFWVVFFKGILGAREREANIVR